MPLVCPVIYPADMHHHGWVTLTRTPDTLAPFGVTVKTRLKS
jgi:hypothetical protein